MHSDSPIREPNTLTGVPVKPTKTATSPVHALLSLLSVQAARTILFVVLLQRCRCLFPACATHSVSKDRRIDSCFQSSRADFIQVKPGGDSDRRPRYVPLGFSRNRQWTHLSITTTLVRPNWSTIQRTPSIRFYAALARILRPGRRTPARITHYGDSPITNDGITGTVRRLLQQRFGDAGHGFIFDRPSLGVVRPSGDQRSLPPVTG